MRCGMRRMQSEGNKSVCKKSGMPSEGEGMECGMIELVELRIKNSRK